MTVFRVRSYSADDRDGVEAVILAGFGSPVPSSDIEQFAHEPHQIVVAVDDREVTGMIAATSYGDAAYIGPMAVHPGHQRRGIGRTLLLELIARLEREGVASMSLEASDAGRPLYEKHGFVSIDSTHRYERTATPEPDAAAPDATVQPADGENGNEHELRAALAFDASAFGYDRNLLLRKLASPRGGSKLLVAGGGYAFARAKMIGPWIATNPNDARSLLERALTERPSIERVIVPQRNVDALRMVEAAGFTSAQSMTHMTRGPVRMNRERIFGLVSPAFG